MVGIDGIIFEDEKAIVIKYKQVYTPNSEVCHGLKFSSYKAMMEAVGQKLEAARDYAECRNIPFTPYTVKNVIKPEFAHEVYLTGIQETSD